MLDGCTSGDDGLGRLIWGRLIFLSIGETQSIISKEFCRVGKSREISVSINRELRIESTGYELRRLVDQDALSPAFAEEHARHGADACADGRVQHNVDLAVIFRR